MTAADRVAGPDRDRRTPLADAQREADTVFAQYQLSQLLALGGDLRALATSVVTELVRVTDAAAGALWLSTTGERSMRLVAVVGDDPAGGEPAGEAVPQLPEELAGADTAAAWTRAAGWRGVALDERRGLGERSLDSRLVGYLAFQPPPGDDLPAEGVRLLALVRHELAIAFQAAQLRHALAGEQALLAAILDGANDGIVAVDEGCRVVRVNRAAMSLLGGTAVVPSSRSCREVLGCAPDDVPGATAGEPGEDGRPGTAARGSLRCGPRCRFEEAMEHPWAPIECEHVVVGRDGTAIPVAASYSAMPGAERGAVVVLRDTRAEIAVEELRASFLAAVSHELRTPLALISGYVDSLLALDLDADAQRRSVERIGHAAGRLAELVDELLELTRFESTGPLLQRSVVHLPSVVARLADDLAESPGARPVRVAIPPDLPSVAIDPLRIGHVLANLVDNARKYGDGGPITVTARGERGAVVVTVHDTGPGVPPEERPHVFDRFYRGRNARDGRTPGTGLGLYVCRRLIEAHGGRIWVEAEGGGSAVSFSLPAAPPEALGEAS